MIGIILCIISGMIFLEYPILGVIVFCVGIKLP